MQAPGGNVSHRHADHEERESADDYLFKHASLAIETEGRHIYIDPISQYADYASLPKPI